MFNNFGKCEEKVEDCKIEPQMTPEPSNKKGAKHSLKAQQKNSGVNSAKKADNFELLNILNSTFFNPPE